MLPLLLAALTSGPDDRGVEFQAPFPLIIAGSTVSVLGGHAAPVYADLDADGDYDLLVGQFTGGIAMLYLNNGTKTGPQFEGGWPFIAGTETAKVDFG